MRGKLKAETRFNNLKEEFLQTYPTELSESHPFVQWFKRHETIPDQYKIVSDETETFLYPMTDDTVLYHTIRMSKRNIRLRELENWSEAYVKTRFKEAAEYNKGNLNFHRDWLYEILVVLYCLDIITFNYLQHDETKFNPSHDVGISIKESDD